MDEKERKRAQATDAMRTMAAVVLLDRAGGRLTFTKAEYDAIVAKYGGASRMTLRVELFKEKGGEANEIRAFLQRKTPKNAELVS